MKEHLDGRYRKNLRPGLHVNIILKQDQKNGTLTYGIIEQILTSKPHHSRGCKVKLKGFPIGSKYPDPSDPRNKAENRIGRVQWILDIPENEEKEFDIYKKY